MICESVSGHYAPATHGSIMSFLRELAEIQSTGGRSGAAAGAGLALLLGTCDDELDPARDGAAGSGEAAPFGCLDGWRVASAAAVVVGGLRFLLRGLGAFSGPQPHCGSASSTVWRFSLTYIPSPRLASPALRLDLVALDPSSAARQAPVP